MRSSLGPRPWLTSLLVSIAVILAAIGDSGLIITIDGNVTREQLTHLLLTGKVLFYTSLAMAAIAAWFAEKMPLGVFVFAVYAVGFVAGAQLWGLLHALFISRWLRLRLS